MSSPTPPPGAPSIPSPTAPTANSANLVGIPPDATSEATAITAQPLGGKMTTTTTTASTPHANPKVAELQIMFPSIDPDVIEVILESCGGSSDRTIETLLQMTDPEFKPETVAVRSEEESQLDLDAQFARSLQMQEQESYRAQPTQPYTQSANANPIPNPQQLPYQPRIRRHQPPVATQQRADPFSYQPQSQDQNHTQGQGQRQGQGHGYSQPGFEEGNNPPGMLAVEERLERFAEVGKQTFNSLFSKAKAKYSEYQAQGPGWKANESDWGREQSQYSSNQSQGGQNQTQNQNQGNRPVYMQGGGRGGEQNRSGTGGLWSEEPRSTTPSMRSESFSSQSTTDPTPVPQQPLRQSSNRWQPSDVYDDPLPPTRTLSATSPSNSGSGRRSPGSTMGVGSPDKGSGKIDLAKLGILPKKRVDLLSTSPQAQNTLSSGTMMGSSTPPPVSANNDSEHDLKNSSDPNPGLPGGAIDPKTLVGKIPKTPPPQAGLHTLGDSDEDDELEYTKNPFDE